MTIEKKYKCNICETNLNPTSPDHEKPQGFALTWLGGSPNKHNHSASLEPVRSWAESPMHICQGCLSAVGTFHDSARKAGELFHND